MRLYKIAKKRKKRRKNDMNNEVKARAIIGEDCKKENCLECGGRYSAEEGGCATYQKIMQMAQWKDEQLAKYYIVRKGENK